MSELNDAYKDFSDRLRSKIDRPDWYRDFKRTLANKNISIEFWNSFEQYVQNIASECTTIANFLQTLEDFIGAGGAVTEQDLENIRAAVLETVKNELLEPYATRDWVAKNAVGERDAGGEIFNDTFTNNARSKAYTILDVKRKRPVQDFEISKGLSGVFVPPTLESASNNYPDVFRAAYFDGTTHSGIVGGYGRISESSWDIKFTPSNSSSKITPFVECRSGDTKCDNGVWTASVNDLKQLNMCTHLVGDNTPFLGTKGKNFIYFARVKRANSAEDYELDTTFSEISLAQLTHVKTKSTQRSALHTVTCDFNGNVYAYNGASKAYLCTLDKDNFTDIAIKVILHEDCLKYTVYINGVPKAVDFTANVIGNAVYRPITEFGLKYTDFAIATVSCCLNPSVSVTDLVKGADVLDFAASGIFLTKEYPYSLDGSYVLDSVDDLCVGDVYSVQVKYAPKLDANGNFISWNGHGDSEHAENFGKIISVDAQNKEVYVDKLFCNGTLDTETVPEDFSSANTFRIISKPDVGSRVLGLCASAGGSHTRAGSNYAFTHGYSNNSFGNYSGTIGRNLTAAYAAFAVNNNSQALGQNSFAGGVSNIVEPQAWASIVFGLGNIVRLAHEMIIGEYATLDTPDPSKFNRGDYLFKIGNGTSDSNRSDALAVTRDGNICLGALKDKAGKFVTVGENGEFIAVDIEVGGTY